MQKLKEKETALRKAEQNILSRDKVINELRLRLPAASERDKIIAELDRNEDDPAYPRALKIAHQTIVNMQARLNQKEEVLKKYQHLLAKAREVFFFYVLLGTWFVFKGSLHSSALKIWAAQLSIIHMWICCECELVVPEESSIHVSVLGANNFCLVLLKEKKSRTLGE